MIEELTHEREDVSVVGCGSKDHLAVTEGIFYILCPVVSCQVTNSYLRATFFFKLLRKDLNSLFRVAINGCVCDQDAFIFRLVGRPGVVDVQIVFQVFGKNRSVERADDLNVKICSSL